MMTATSPSRNEERRPRRVALWKGLHGGVSWGCCIAFLIVSVGLVSAAGIEEGSGKPPLAPAAAEMRLRAVLDCMKRGRELFGRGDFIHAAMQFEKVLGLDPSNSAAAILLKRCEKRLGAGDNVLAAEDAEAATGHGIKRRAEE